MWIYGVIIIFIVGYWMFGPGNGVPVKSDWNTVAQMIEQGKQLTVEEFARLADAAGSGADASGGA